MRTRARFIPTLGHAILEARWLLATRQPGPSRQPEPFGRGFSLSVIALRPAGACPRDWRGTLPAPGSFASSCPLPTAAWTLRCWRLSTSTRSWRADASVAWCVWNGNVHWTTARLPKEVGLEIFSDPTMILANSTRPTGRATVAEGGYRVSGRWSLVSGCQLSAWFILMCAVYEDGQARATPAGTPEYRFMLCPASECDIVDTWNVSGLRGTGSHDVAVQDRFVPASYASFHTDPLVLTDPRCQLP